MPHIRIKRVLSEWAEIIKYNDLTIWEKVMVGVSGAIVAALYVVSATGILLTIDF